MMDRCTWKKKKRRRRRVLFTNLGLHTGEQSKATSHKVSLSGIIFGMVPNAVSFTSGNKRKKNLFQKTQKDRKLATPQITLPTFDKVKMG